MPRSKLMISDNNDEPEPIEAMPDVGLRDDCRLRLDRVEWYLSIVIVSRSSYMIYTMLANCVFLIAGDVRFRLCIGRN